MTPARHLATGLLLGAAIASAAVTRAAAAAAPAVPNRQPLLSDPLVPLPLGDVRPAGWLKTELELARDGLTGHAEELLPALRPNSGWLGGTGKNSENWEKGPYYVKGLVALAYTLDDAGLKQKAQKWIDWSLNSQQKDGSFGPLSNNDWWPRMVMTYALRQYGEATGDPRVLPMLQKYLHYMLDELPRRPLKDWAKSRAGDQIDTAYWVYNRTGDPAMLQLARLLHDQAYDWTDIFTRNRFRDFGNDFQPSHAVNIAQAMKMPAVWYQQSNEPADRDAFAIGLQHLLHQTTLPLDVTTGTETLAGRSAIQGVETCTVVEQMLSDETAFAILADPAIADALERTAYNALPGAMTKDLKLYQYYTATNNVAAVPGGHGFDQDYADGMMPGPISGYPCCCYNLHMGWPMLVQHAWVATADGGLAPAIYGPTTVQTFLPKAGQVSIAEQTDYPFGDRVHFVLSLQHPSQFPLKLRIPAWCRDASVSVNGTVQPPPGAGTFANLNRSWNNGDTVDLSLPMPLSTIPGVNNSISLARGPLVYSLKLPQVQHPTHPGPDGFVQLKITSPQPWNYALNVDPSQPQQTVKVDTAPMPIGTPFDPDHSPVTLSVAARPLDGWRTNWTGRVSEDPPHSPVQSDEPQQTVTLVPFGAQTLRITAFPWLGTPAAPASTFRCDFHDTEAPGWIDYGGGWYVRDGRYLVAASTAGVKSVAANTDFPNFTYDADVTPGTHGDTGLIFRATHPSIGPNAFDGYYLGLVPERGQVILGRCSAADNSWTPLAQATHAIQPGEPVHMRVVANGPSINVYLDQSTRPIIQVSDSSYPAGAIGLRQYASSHDGVRPAFANIAVVGLGVQ